MDRTELCAICMEEFLKGKMYVRLAMTNAITTFICNVQ